MYNTQRLTEVVHRPSETGSRDPFLLRMRRAAAFIAVLAGAMVLLMLHMPSYFVLRSDIYLPLHIAMEVFAVIVSAMVFGIGWHSFDNRIPPAIMALSSAFLAVGMLDLGHLLSFPGMPDFVSPSSVAKGIDFWLAARAAGAVALLAAAVLPWRATPPGYRHLMALGASGGFTCLMFWVTLFRPELLPDTFVPGRGLTTFKIVSEYVLAATYLLAAAILLQQALATRAEKTVHLFSAACIMALSEFCFTLYVNATDLFNVLGHVYKVLAYLYLYRAIFVEGVHEPFQRLKASERSLKLSESKFRKLMEFAPEAILLMDRSHRILMMNARAEQLFGYRPDALVGMPMRMVMASDADDKQMRRAAKNNGHAAATSIEAACRHRDGELFPVEINLGHLDTEDLPLVIALVRDISERKHFETLLLDQLTHDALTGLPNRLLIHERLRDAINRMREAKCMLAVLFLDIDHFKRINDTFGHALGDEVLRQTALRMQQSLRNGDLLARQGGDEFIILQQEIAHVQEAVTLANRLLECMREPFHVAGREIFLSVSVGISLFPSDEATEDGLLHTADIAMNSAKEKGRNCYRFHTREMDLAIRERQELEGHLRYAVEKGELLLHYQPRISIATGAQIGMEALVRWRHPEFGLISPARFIPVAEESGLIEQIGLWVLRTACAQAKEWQKCGLPMMRVSVNLSARQFQQAALARNVQAILDEFGLDPACLELEITESTVMKDTELAIKVLRSLKQLGIGLSIDDFGTGYSSLSYLKLFPIDVLKIDRSFIKDVIDDPNDAAITRAIIALAHSLDLVVVAEGVETLEQAIFLKQCACDEIQGFYFSRPLPVEEMAALLHEQRAMNIPDRVPMVGTDSGGANVTSGG
ncbi:EAL domain-containing protein [Noviherbaspirillum sp.]|uniref:bifunctional diguanylate cyclase/phosphodiesterase n=1 Tax=Noviherbaspirillum sp. TaxID=1926288 RepID=UPI0025D91A86|nr:EAL domain-containing protein [Noviherbaspirillum sp.]